jgi:NADPH-dependent 2,4-dienoyl-CoA reductase/sulfur reductase-like enzyme
VADPVVIVGASLAGVRAAERLRKDGYDGEVVIVGAEQHQPYDRPPLSKRAVDGTAASDDAVREAAALSVDEDLEATWRLGTSATGLDLDGRRLSLSDGDDLAWSKLVIATGASPRVLPAFAEKEGVHVVRTLDDALRLRRELDDEPRVAIVGAGFIGLEVASSCRKRGLAVTVLEPQPAPLAHALGTSLGQAFAAMHEREGTQLRLGVSVSGPLGDGRVAGVALEGGERVDADLVVMGVGVSPTTGWLEGSGVDLGDGVRCDEALRVLVGGTPRPDVVAAGDVARWASPWAPEPVRVEHWTNAVEQGDAAARTLLDPDGAEAFGPVPYVWSDQCGVKVQVVGRPTSDDEVQELEGTPGEGKWVVAFGRERRLTGAVGAGKPGRVMKLKAALMKGTAFPVEDG